MQEILFRSGRIDAVYGIALADGGRVVVKTHRPPADQRGLAATRDALRHLAGHGYPCPEPIDGPVVVEGHTVTIQSLLDVGSRPDARRPEVRRTMAAAHAAHVELLAAVPGGVPALAARLGPRPAWTDYTSGPWPTPHDAVFDFSRTPPGWAWLTRFASDAADEVRRLRGPSPSLALAHGDWYAGNLLLAGARVTGVFDWDLVADHEAVLVGLVSGGFLADDAPGPDDVAGYLDDYHRARPLRADDRRLAVASARWMLAYNARCDLAMLPGQAGGRGRAGL